jgi:hypothetical protein
VITSRLELNSPHMRTAAIPNRSDRIPPCATKGPLGLYCLGRSFSRARRRVLTRCLLQIPGFRLENLYDTYSRCILVSRSVRPGCRAAHGATSVSAIRLPSLTQTPRRRGGLLPTSSPPSSPTSTVRVACTGRRERQNQHYFNPLSSANRARLRHDLPYFQQRDG